MSATVAERVAAGAAFLDEHDPQWWRADVERAINLDTLMLSSSELCVLGQRCPLEVLAQDIGTTVGLLDADDGFQRYYAYGYALMKEAGKRGALYDWAKEHGFSVGDGMEWGALTAEWKRVIVERRAAACRTCDGSGVLMVPDADGESASEHACPDAVHNLKAGATA